MKKFRPQLLKERREKLGYGLREFCRKIEIGVGYYSDIENGYWDNLSDKKLESIANGLEIDKEKISFLQNNMLKKTLISPSLSRATKKNEIKMINFLNNLYGDGKLKIEDVYNAFKDLSH